MGVLINELLIIELLENSAIPCGCPNVVYNVGEIADAAFLIWRNSDPSSPIL